mgnify:CR=1 FL=1
MPRRVGEGKSGRGVPGEGGDIAEEVRRAIEADEGMRPYGINVEATGGKVRLWGVVDVLAEKNRAEEIARSVQGVREVVNDLTISTDGKIRDSDVAFEAQEELAAEPGVDPRHIGATAKGGTVILKGEVKDEAEVNAAMEAAAKARG